VTLVLEAVDAGASLRDLERAGVGKRSSLSRRIRRLRAEQAARRARLDACAERRPSRATLGRDLDVEEPLRPDRQPELAEEPEPVGQSNRPVPPAVAGAGQSGSAKYLSSHASTAALAFSGRGESPRMRAGPETIRWMTQSGAATKTATR
jgi:hypothetical protein